MEILYNILLIFIVIMVFNFVIFFHELGHFLAAKWRGLKVDRFQIWFGKPIWKKTIGGVQYGLGWIPAGGFVSLPQLVTMESIEGKVGDEEKENLPPAKPIDKIIVAFAGPLFSFILAMMVAVIVWQVGVPENKLNTTTVGYIREGAPAEGKFKLGDKILEVEGVKVDYWTGSPPQDSVLFQVVVSDGDTVDFKVERDGQVIDVSTGFVIPEKHFLRRKGHRQVGIMCERECIVLDIIKDSPASQAGLQKGDKIVAIDGQKAWGHDRVAQLMKGKKELEISYERGGKLHNTKATLAIPRGYKDAKLGVAWDPQDKFAKFAGNIVYRDPLEQSSNHVGLMWTTIKKIATLDNDIDPQQLNSPVGIAMTYFDLLKSEHGWRLILTFTVLLNINLAILNMLPLPVLDGGHITVSFYEMIMGKQLPAKMMEYVQGGFVLLLLTFMFWIMTKDVFDRWWWDKPAKQGDLPPAEMIFDPPKKAASTDIDAGNEGGGQLIPAPSGS